MPKPDDTEDNSNELDDASRIQNVVETANAEDENDSSNEDDENSNDDSDEGGDDNKDKDADSDKDSEDDENDSDDDEDEEENADDKSDKDQKPERKFKNLAADDDAQYIENVEKAYENSSAEAIRLNDELGKTNRRIDAILSAAQKDPDLAKKLNEVLGGNVPDPSGDSDKGDDKKSSNSDDPFLVNSRTEWENKSRKEVEDILAANPEINTDPALNAKVKHWMEIFSNEEFETNKRLMSGGEAMEAAMKHLGIEDGRKKKQDVVNKSKELGAPSKPTKTRTPKPSKGKGLSEDAGKFADALGVARDKAEKFVQQ